MNPLRWLALCYLVPQFQLLAYFLFNDFLQRFAICAGEDGGEFSVL